jgi:16S rRNA (guanine527-N7)-methyltransferase
MRPDPDALPPRLVRYVEAVLAENERVNLTGAKTLDDALDVLAVDSLPVADAWGASRPPPRVAPRLAVDLGTGNGLPGVAVALAWPTARVVLVERREKKAAAVARCLVAAGIENAEVLACDGREVVHRRPDLREAVDLVTVRAVGDLAPTTAEAAPWLARAGRIVHWKPGDLDPAERAGGDAAARRLGLRVVPDVEYALRSGARRRLVTYERP